MEEIGSVTNVTRMPTRQAAPARPTEDFSEEIALLLAEAEPLTEESPAAPERPGLCVPEPSHRNAVSCPQCDQKTWRSTSQCVHCGFDLAGYVWREAMALVRAAEVRHKKLRMRWAVGSGVVGAAAILFCAFLPVAVGFPVSTVALLVVLAAAAVEW